MKQVHISRDYVRELSAIERQALCNTLLTVLGRLGYRAFMREDATVVIEPDPPDEGPTARLTQLLREAGLRPYLHRPGCEMDPATCECRPDPPAVGVR